MANLSKRTMLALAGMLAAVCNCSHKTPPISSGPTVTPLAAPAKAQEAVGVWVGIIEPAPGARLPLVVHIKRDDAGALIGTMDSPAQGVQGLPLAEIAVEAESLAFTVPPVGGSFKGQWDMDTRAWKGAWSQAGQRWPLSLTVPPAPQPLPADWQLPPDAEIGELIAARNARRAGQGIVVGVLGPEGRRIVAGGTGAGAKVDGNTLFEIGSITKVFTALILADMVNKGEVSLDDPAAKFLPPGHRMPERGGRQITLRELATHRSGLPRMPDNIGPMTDPDGPFAGYTEDKLLAFLDRCQLTRDIGSQWEYSNLGAGLLGYLLARAAGKDYEALLHERITGPLGMNDTKITLPPRHAKRLAPPFDAHMQPARPWNTWVLTAAGGLRSSAADMLNFAAAVLDPNSPIAPAMRTALSVRAPASHAPIEQALGWVVMHPEPGRELLLHDGGTGGFRSVVALEPSKGRAVVALINSAAEPAAADLGLHILIGSPLEPTPPVPPAPPPPRKRTEISLSAAELGNFVGRYDFGSGFVIAVTHEGGTLRARREGIAGAPALQIFAEGPLAFFWKEVDAQIRFTVDASGAVTGAEFAQGGMELTGKRIKP
ncbi:serine hydrolase [Nannocystis sp. SCPEA4]|uniref:serine hydrolase n=1 Tax=Nannocystis sp. SCPEA4 TaxID=2996787 RepID=UPI00227210BC|nr:serine hydrolase [Nannocystis sp. SCPEA4]MCY1054833.1 serine hydrolase [Nannocystis sp. SCPEA4]